jgi:regulator of Ty1 transposition protein 103
VSDVTSLSKIKDKEQARALKKTIEEALKILNDYNAKLDVEMQQRKELRQMLVNYLHSLKQKQAKIDEVLAEKTALLERAEKFEADMKAHFASLPDLSSARQFSLPAPSDLFR